MTRKPNEATRILDQQTDRLSRIQSEMNALQELLLCAKEGEPLPSEALLGLSYLFESYAERLGSVNSALNEAFRQMAEGKGTSLR